MSQKAVEVREERKMNEKNGRYHIHVEGRHEDYTEQDTVAIANVGQNIMSALDEQTSSKVNLMKQFDERAASVSLPKHEHIRLRIKATLMAYFVIGCFAFFTTLGALVYYTRSFPLMAENGLKGVLVIMIVQGLSLIFSSLLGLRVYSSGQTPRALLLYFNLLLFSLIGILISINWTVPETSVMIYQSELALRVGHGTRRLAGNWCCDLNGYKEKCSHNEHERRGHSPDFENTTDEASRLSFDLECSRLMGWSLTEKMIKSMSYFLIPALLTITLTNSLVHFASSKRHLNPVCIKKQQALSGYFEGFGMIFSRRPLYVSSSAILQLIN